MSSGQGPEALIGRAAAAALLSFMLIVLAGVVFPAKAGIGCMDDEGQVVGQDVEQEESC